MPEESHTESERYRWTIAIPDHPKRIETAGYVASRALMRKIVDTVPGWIFGTDHIQDHHGGAIWVYDSDGWLCLGLPLGIEWSAQFCADPTKVDKLRVYAQRLIAAFPGTIAKYEELGYSNGQELLDTQITTADQVARWTDSIFNASVPLPAAVHTGVLPTGAGYHHYPKPIVDINHFRRDDFNLFVTDDNGLPLAVVPVSADPNDKRVRVLAANPASPYADRLFGDATTPPSDDHDDHVPDDGRVMDASVLAAEDPISRKAFEPRPVDA